MDAPKLRTINKHTKYAYKTTRMHLDQVTTDHRTAGYLIGKLNTAILNEIRLANSAPRMRISEMNYRFMKEYERSNKESKKHHNDLVQEKNGVDTEPK